MNKKILSYILYSLKLPLFVSAMAALFLTVYFGVLSNGRGIDLNTILFLFPFYFIIIGVTYNIFSNATSEQYLLRDLVAYGATRKQAVNTLIAIESLLALIYYGVGEILVSGENMLLNLGLILIFTSLGSLLGVVVHYFGKIGYIAIIVLFIIIISIVIQFYYTGFRATKIGQQVYSKEIFVLGFGVIMTVVSKWIFIVRGKKLMINS